MTDHHAGGAPAARGPVPQHPLPRGAPWTAWLFLGALSTAIAETLSGSTPLVLVLPWGLAVVLPLYALHTLVLGSLVIRPGRRVTFGMLFAAGALFGLYEAYITKVLWAPTWNDDPFRVGGVAAVETMVLVLFWHPVLAFIAPLAIGERLIGRGEFVRSALPRAVRARLDRPRWLYGTAAAAGALHGGMVHSPVIAAASLVTTLGVLWVLRAWWRARLGAARIPLADLLPRGRARRVLAGALVGMYLVLGAAMRRDALPPVRDHVAIWGLYALFGVLLWVLVRRAGPENTGPEDTAAEDTAAEDARAEAVPPPLPVSGRRLLAAFAVASLVASVVFIPMPGVPAAVVWLVGLVGGVAFLAATVREALRRPAAGREPSRTMP